MSRKRNLRRTLLGAAATLAPLILLALTGPAGTVQARVTVAGRAVAGTAARGPLSPIKHVVVLYLENHSFDSLLGFWCDDNPGRCPAGGMPRQVRLSNGAVVTPSVGPDIPPPMDHSVAAQIAAIDQGNMDGWQLVAGCQRSKRYACIAGYKPSQEPNLAALASQFAISDRFFSQQDNWSWVAHIYAVAGSADGFTATTGMRHNGHGAGWGCDSDHTIESVWSHQLVPSCVPDPSLTYHGAPLPNGGAFEPTPVPHVPTIMTELNQAGLSWKLYEATCAHMVTHANGLKTCTLANDAYHWAICPTFAQCLYSPSGLTPTAQFFTDANQGTLPAFSIVTPQNPADSEHNGFSMTTGDNWLGKVASAVMNSPDWNSTALFITWDDCGCFFDQVPPVLNPDGTQQGPRVPLVIVSPWVRQGYTDDTSATFASILAFTEHVFGLRPLTVNDARAYDLHDAFQFHHAVARVPMVTRPRPRGEHIDWAQAKEDT